MTARAVWKGVVQLGDGVPVKLYSAVEDRSLHFRLLHRDDRVPVDRQMVNPETGDAVEYDEALRAYETDDGRRVVLDDADLDAVEPDPSREIEVLRFVEPGEIPHPWYDRPYLLGPDGDDEGWAALATALGETGLEGVVRWVMRGTRYLGSLRLHRGAPMLVTLRRAGEVVEVSRLEAPSGRELEDDELRMAHELVESMEGPFEPEAWEDEHRERLRELIEAKAEGKTISLGEYRERREAGASLREALEASLEEAGERKGA